MLDALVTALSIGLLWVIILAIDARAGDQMARFVRTTAVTNGGMAAEVHQGVSYAARSVTELSYIYGPLMTFSAVAAVLFLVLARTR